MDPEDPSTWPREARELWERRQRAARGNPELVRALEEQERASGPIPFAELMRSALYDPLHGYYASGRQRTGPQGDFVTSPTLHPAFGAALEDLALRLWRHAGRPGVWTLVEMGAGGGDMARDLLSAAAGGEGGEARRFAAALRYRIVEPFPRLRERQEAALLPLGLGSRLSWVEDLSALEPLTGVLLSNELVDAFPVHRLRFVDGRLEEAHAVVGAEGFEERWLAPSSDAVRRAALALQPRPMEGQPFELNLEARGWLRQCAGRLRRGFLLTLDYGDEAARLYSGRFPQGTLMAYRSHGTGDPYRALGDQDLTARVDFTALREEGERCRLWSAPLVTQRDLLLRFAPWSAGLDAESPAPRAREALEALVDPEGLGSVKVLLQGKDVPPVGLPDLLPARPSGGA